jgi:hypothetical protein
MKVWRKAGVRSGLNSVACHQVGGELLGQLSVLARSDQPAHHNAGEVFRIA